MIIPNWHPIFVHFTIALLTVAVALFFLARYTRDEQRKQLLEGSAKLLLHIGVGITLITLAAGFYAYFTVAHDDPSHVVMKQHRNLALGTTLLFIAILVVIKKGKQQSPGNALMSAMLIATASLAVTGWYGSELVYRHGIGVISLPVSSGAGHDHSEGGHDDVEEQDDTEEHGADVSEENDHDNSDGHHDKD